MPLTYVEAESEVYRAILDVWIAEGHDPVLIGYPNKPNKELTPPPKELYMMLELDYVQAPRRSLGGPTGKSRYDRLGFTTARIFVPMGSKGRKTALEIAQAFADATEGIVTPGGVIFRETRLDNIGPSKAHYQVNVTADFEFCEIK